MHLMRAILMCFSMNLINSDGSNGSKTYHRLLIYSVLNPPRDIIRLSVRLCDDNHLFNYNYLTNSQTLKSLKIKIWQGVNKVHCIYPLKQFCVWVKTWRFSEQIILFTAISSPSITESYAFWGQVDYRMTTLDYLSSILHDKYHLYKSVV